MVPLFMVEGKDKLEDMDMDVSLEKVGCLEWANTSNLNNSKTAHSFYELFQDMKMLDICGH